MDGTYTTHWGDADKSLAENLKGRNHVDRRVITNVP
jgi:hypothetical protein